MKPAAHRSDSDAGFVYCYSEWVGAVNFVFHFRMGSQLSILSPMVPIYILLTGILLGISSLSSASSPVHLLGFVETLCAGETNCFELRVEQEYLDLAASRILVRYDGDSQIYDPENYELTLQQSNIVEGSHLRLLLMLDDDGLESNYYAQFIWIGD